MSSISRGIQLSRDRPWSAATLDPHAKDSPGSHQRIPTTGCLFVASTGHRSLGKLPQILHCTHSQPSTSTINHLHNMPIGSPLPVHYLWRNCAADPNPMSPISTTPPESLQKLCRLIHRKSHSSERPTTHISSLCTSGIMALQSDKMCIHYAGRGSMIITHKQILQWGHRATAGSNSVWGSTHQ